MTLRILLADDDPRLRREVRLDLEESGFTVCAEADDGPDAVAAAVTERPDICILDVSMPGGGIAAAGAIRARVPHSRVVMLTASRDRENLLAAVRAGASGYLLKEIEADRLREALTDVADEDVMLLPDLVPHVIAAFESAPGHRRLLRRPRPPALTQAERSVLDLVHEGRPAREIAHALAMPREAVRGHVARVLQKLDAFV